MKFVCVLAACLFCFSSPAVLVNGQNYLPLAAWARANGFRIARIAGTEIVLTNRTSRLVFNADSADSVINGVDVRLSFPVAKGGLISQLDVDTALRPLLFPAVTGRHRITTICLDPGHGGKDSGNRVGSRFFGYSEKTYTLALAQELRTQLQRAGFRVVLTRSRDVYVDLPLRPAMANRNGADLFISLHFNASPSDSRNVSGPETYCITPVGAASSNSQGEGRNYGTTAANRIQDKSLLLAYEMQRSLTLNLHAEDRGVRRARFAVLRDATMPAILIEGGYMTHPVEGKKIFSSAYRKEMAAAIVKGILAYQKRTDAGAPGAAGTATPAPRPAHPHTSSH